MTRIIFKIHTHISTSAVFISIIFEEAVHEKLKEENLIVLNKKAMNAEAAIITSGRKQTIIIF